MANEGEITGTVKSVRKDKKGVQLTNGIWYASKFFKGQLSCKPGDKVHVLFQENNGFYNLVGCETVESAPDKETVKMEIRQDASISQLTSYAKDLVVAAKAMTGTEVKVTMKEAATAVAAAYKQIKKALQEEPAQEPVQEEDW